MKLNPTIAVATALLGGAFLSHTPWLVRAQSPPAAEPKLHVYDMATSHGNAIILAADSIDRDASTIRLKGNVEIKLRPLQPDLDVMVLHADEAVYHRHHDEIVPQGNVRITLEKPK